MIFTGRVSDVTSIYSGIKKEKTKHLAWLDCHLAAATIPRVLVYPIATPTDTVLLVKMGMYKLVGGIFEIKQSQCILLKKRFKGLELLVFICIKKTHKRT